MGWFKIPLTNVLHDNAMELQIMMRINELDFEKFFHFEEVAIYKNLNIKTFDQSFYFFISDNSSEKFNSIFSDFGAVKCEMPSPESVQKIGGDNNFFNKFR